ncbi:ShlB/FhaC/HecB family hemolysin secretion/activation protein [Novipirellula galeiformis]|uniref:ShlB/FhaC/HecB family hemolysin secretion/activation protein n=1 Tax=Novipirellula galeiformis TaxID=2528004 RepID=UPI001E2A09B7|nr:ShlB/FhaC/HecB family hemolysin secretion/activation protein [Novipirellula galeiformis]
MLSQDYQRYRPLRVDELRPQSIPRVEREPLAEVEGSDKVLVDELKAVIIWDDAQQIDPEEAHEGITGIDVRFAARDSLVYRSGVQGIVRGYIGGQVTLRNLNQMSRDIILYYRKCGQPVVDVVIPEQKITAGVVQIVVIESRIDRVQVKGGRYFNAKELCRWVQCTQSGNRIYESNISNDLFWLNQNPFRIVGVDLKAGKEDGTTDVIFEVKDVFPIRTYLGYDDTGVQSLGLERFNAGIIYGNFLHRDGILSYQYTADGDFSLLEAHAVSYSQPINREWSFNSYGSWAGVRPSVPGFNQDGESWQLGTAVTRHWKKNRYVDFNTSLGLDFKSTNNNLEFGGVQVQDSTADLVEIRLGLSYLRRFCGTEYLYINSDTFVGPGDGFTKDNTTAAFDTIRADTDPTFVYSRLRMERLWNVKNDYQVIGRFAGQLSSERLLYSETLGYGGFDSIRGYDQRTYNADNGWIANLEVGPQPYRWGDRAHPNIFRMFGFVDAGQGFVLNAQPGEVPDQFLISAGVGIRASINDRVSLRAEYGHGFEDVPGIASRDRVHIGLVSLMGPRP